MWNWGTLQAFSLATLNQRMGALSGVIAEILRRQEGVAIWVDGDTTPSVSAAGAFRTANTGATSVTQFDNGRPGQMVVVVFEDGNTTLIDGANLVLDGGADFTGAAGDTRQFVSVDGTIFRQVPLG